LPHGGLALGIGAEAAYRTSDPVAIESGDVLVLCTEGIPESSRRAPSGGLLEFFGEERLREAVRERRGQSPRAIVEGLLEEVSEFVGDADPDDDRTLAVVTDAVD